jgi:hypothetical protein
MNVEEINDIWMSKSFLVSRRYLLFFYRKSFENDTWVLELYEIARKEGALFAKQSESYINLYCEGLEKVISYMHEDF